MKLRILEIKYFNIREFKDLIIPLNNNGNLFPISVIQMPNGLGKTTTMTLLRYALDGSITQLDENTIRSFRIGNVSKGSFQVKLSINDEIHHVRINFDFDKGKASYSSSKIGVSGGLESGFFLPSEVRALFTPDFVKLFVFDGEVASKIIDISKSEAENAIKSLYSLDKILSIKKTVSELISKKQMQTQSSNVTTMKGIKILKGNLETCELTLKGLHELQSHNEKNLRDANKIIKECTDELTNKGVLGKDFSQKITDIQVELSKCEGNIKLNVKEIIQKASELPININPILKKRLDDFYSEMTKLKLPKSTTTAFFAEILEQNECICGRKLEESHKETIRIKLKEYLTDDEVGEINSIKTCIRNLPEIESINELIDNARKFNREYKQGKRALDKLTIDRDEILKKGNLLEYLDKLTKAQQAQKEAISDLKMINETDMDIIDENGYSWKENIKKCKIRQEKLIKELAEATGTVKFSSQALIFNDIIDSIVDESLKRLKIKIKDNTNKKIEKILRRKDIQVGEIGTSLKIINRSGVSEGQKLSIAYSFLASLFEEALHSLPFVVDSPAGPLDLRVRKEVSELIPQLFEQFIVFVISSEKDKFADTFYKNNNAQFLTLWKDQNDQVRKDDTLEFFINFHSEDEKVN